MKQIFTTLLSLFSLGLSAQNVGIGISTPIAKLHVKGSGSLYTPPASSGVGVSIEPGILIENITSSGNPKAGLYSYTEGSTGINRSLLSVAGGTGFFNIGVHAVAFATTAGTNYALYTEASGTGSRAGYFNGVVQIADGSQGAGRVFMSDAGGTGTWTSLATAGLVSGSGTLNYLPKWTPSGTVLGNSQVFDDGTNVGVGTAAPLSKLHVVGSGSLYTPPASSGIGVSIEPGNLTEDFISSGNAKTGVYSYTEGSTFINRGILSVAGGTGVYNIALHGTAAATTTGTNYAVYGEAYGTASRAGYFYGKVQIQDGTEGAARVFTSDASGTGTWQSMPDIRVKGLPALSIPPNTIVPITQWSSVSYEDGGTNYNAPTGEYTAAFTGLYQVNALVLWNQFSAVGWADIIPRVNGVTMEDAITNASTSGTYLTTQVSIDLRLTAGDKVQMALYQSSSASQTIPGFSGENHFSVHFIHQ